MGELYREILYPVRPAQRVIYHTGTGRRKRESRVQKKEFVRSFASVIIIWPFRGRSTAMGGTRTRLGRTAMHFVSRNGRLWWPLVSPCEPSRTQHSFFFENKLWCKLRTNLETNIAVNIVITSSYKIVVSMQQAALEARGSHLTSLRGRWKEGGSALMQFPSFCGQGQQDHYHLLY